MPNFWPKGCTFYTSQFGYCDIFHNPVLQLTFKNCILYDWAYDSIRCRDTYCLLVYIYCRYNKPKLSLTKTVENSTFHDSNERFNC